MLLWTFMSEFPWAHLWGFLCGELPRCETANGRVHTSSTWIDTAEWDLVRFIYESLTFRVIFFWKFWSCAFQFKFFELTWKCRSFFYSEKQFLQTIYWLGQPSLLICKTNSHMPSFHWCIGLLWESHNDVYFHYINAEHCLLFGQKISSLWAHFTENLKNSIVSIAY